MVSKQNLRHRCRKQQRDHHTEAQQPSGNTLKFSGADASSDVTDRERRGSKGSSANDPLGPSGEDKSYRIQTPTQRARASDGVRASDSDGVRHRASDSDRVRTEQATESETAQQQKTQCPAAGTPPRNIKYAAPTKQSVAYTRSIENGRRI